jgi:hypothetical protein
VPRDGYDPVLDDGLAYTAVLATRIRRTHSDFEDALQEARLAIFIAWPTWKEGMISWPSYAVLCARRALRYWLSKQNKRGFLFRSKFTLPEERQKPKIASVMPDSDELPCSESEPVVDEVCRNDTDEFVRRYLETTELSPRTMEVCQAVMNDEVLAEFDRVRGRCTRASTSVLVKSRQKLREHLASVNPYRRD